MSKHDESVGETKVVTWVGEVHTKNAKVVGYEGGVIERRREERRGTDTP